MSSADILTHFGVKKKKLEKRGVVLNSRSEAFIKEYSIKRREKSSVLPKVRSPAKVQKQDTIATKTRRQRKHRLKVLKKQVCVLSIFLATIPTHSLCQM